MTRSAVSVAMVAPPVGPTLVAPPALLRLSHNTGADQNEKGRIYVRAGVRSPVRRVVSVIVRTVAIGRIPAARILCAFLLVIKLNL